MPSDAAIRGYVTAGLRLLPTRFDTPAARVLMTAIGLQESRFEHTDQLEANGKNTVLGPALGYYQFEKGGGVKGVMTHPSSQQYAKAACAELAVSWERDEVWRALRDSPALAGVFARLLLYTDPHPLPVVGDAEAAWAYYLRNWRPGKPHRGTWDSLYERACLMWGEA